ncbi:MAG: hypothetical protein ACE5GK_05945 [Nitrospiria bacterium]
MNKSMLYVFLLGVGLLSTLDIAGALEADPTIKQDAADAPSVERLTMGGSEIQGTIEKPHVVYLVPWKDTPLPNEQDMMFDRSFKDEILENIDYDRFQNQWSDISKPSKGDETND